jgi:hypothetical protein
VLRECFILASNLYIWQLHAASLFIMLRTMLPHMRTSLIEEAVNFVLIQVETLNEKIFIAS